MCVYYGEEDATDYRALHYAVNHLQSGYNEQHVRRNEVEEKRECCPARHFVELVEC